VIGGQERTVGEATTLMMSDEDRQQIIDQIEAVIEANTLDTAPVAYAIGALDAFNKCIAIVRGDTHKDMFQGVDRRKLGPRMLWEPDRAESEE
jgi:hypothetical protein